MRVAAEPRFEVTEPSRAVRARKYLLSLGIDIENAMGEVLKCRFFEMTGNIFSACFCSKRLR
jgi:hypothetical protein